MATKQDLDFTYSNIDKIFRLSFGEMADYSGARFNGDFTRSLEEGQRQKHQFICKELKHVRGFQSVIKFALVLLLDIDMFKNSIRSKIKYKALF